ncbi:AraC family transcriptional regulator [Neobacillus sp. WH10]|uniref:GyrI-like domain-containing protein n=1 Tax=Neobacillus sp. WH10 TaxID=3047873 RepID=UPI0024C157D1|nr:AraC family transcriptional regulator [Neobacillus sp. WH10]WHY77396.1 AraC family transcriptional regulator [Neobacillus sp. WH10]
MKLTIINSIRTNNFNDEHVMQKITDMWKAASTDLAEHESVIYGVYHEYETDYKGDYTLSVAIEGETKPLITIPIDEKYKIFKVDTTEEQGIFNTWSKIWDEEKEGNLHRSYTYDLEKYYPNGNIEIHIAIK